MSLSLSLSLSVSRLRTTSIEERKDSGELPYTTTAARLNGSHPPEQSPDPDHFHMPFIHFLPIPLIAQLQ